MSQDSKGKYLYCVIRAAEPREFPCPGVDGRGVHTIHQGDLAAVAGDSQVPTYLPTRSAAMAHQTVVQEVMRGFTVLPFSFGTVAEGEEQVRELLARYREEFLAQLRHLEGKREFGLKALWRDKEQPFQEILAQREDIRRFRDALAQRPPAQTYQERIQLGTMVQEALEARKEVETRHILERLQPLAAGVKVNAVSMDQMLLNAAFLLAVGRESPFEEALSSLDQEYQGRLRFRLVGPFPPFNFVRLPISWQ